MLVEHVLYIILAIAGLGFLIFIHELGHFWMARREGMKVEAFSIGFGPVIRCWMRDGVRWQICCLPFGGYVKIAGMQKEGSLEPYEIANGFYSKQPLQRIRVAFMGPFVNIAFAFAVFSLIWASGGREKPFQDFTRSVGWVDPRSPLYAEGLRPGDLIERCGNRRVAKFEDLFIAYFAQGCRELRGTRTDEAGRKTAFALPLKPEKEASRKSRGRPDASLLPRPAEYLIYQDGAKLLETSSPMAESGIRPRDRIVWANGELIFSRQQLSRILNEPSAFLTVRRGGETFRTSVPRIPLNELKTTAVQRAEIDDWQHEANLKGPLQDLFVIPYLLSPSGEVEVRFEFLDERDRQKAWEGCERCASFRILEEGDQILAINGEPVSSPRQLLERIQTKQVLLIVQRSLDAAAPVSWKEAQAEFEASVDGNSLQQIVSGLGTDSVRQSAGDFVLLRPVSPKPLSKIAAAPENGNLLAKRNARIQQEINAIKDLEEREIARKQYEEDQKRLYLGIPLGDRDVIYNPSPLEQFGSVALQTWMTLKSLVSGQLSPKYLSGPIGIVQAVHYGWTQGIKDALFWMGFVSLNLGIVNLLPIPILDGGHIMFSLFERITRRRLSAKLMERLVLPFVGLLVAFFLYITYYDLSRLFSGF